LKVTIDLFASRPGASSLFKKLIFFTVVPTSTAFAGQISSWLSPPPPPLPPPQLVPSTAKVETPPRIATLPKIVKSLNCFIILELYYFF
jgi:hypothetical protein